MQTSDDAPQLARPLQESLLALLIFDEAHGGLVASMVSPQLFDGDYADIARGVCKYWKDWGKPPKHQVDELFADIFTERTGRDITYGNLFTALFEAHERGLNAKFLIDNINRFTRFQRLKRLIVDSAEKARAQDVKALDDIEAAIDEYRKLKLEVAAPAVSLQEYEKVLDRLDIRAREFLTGIDTLDRARIVPGRGQMFIVLGPPGAGKSWHLIQIAKQAMLKRKRVLFVSLEMDAYEVAGRFYQSLLGVSTRETDAYVTRLAFEGREDDRDDRPGKLVGFNRKRLSVPFTLADEEAATELAMHIREYEGLFDNLRIRQYPGRMLTPETLSAMVDIDAASTGFIPDMIVLDYIGIMHLDTRDIRVSLGQTGVALRALAQTRGIAMVTAQQVSREGVKEQKAGREIDIEHTAEDWTLMQTADIAVTMSQTRTEAELGLMRLYVGKSRNEMAKFTTLVTQNYAVGQFVYDAYRIPSGYSKAVDDYMKSKDREQEDDDPDTDFTRSRRE